MRRLLTQVPTTLDDADGDGDSAFTKAVRAVRDHVASRWSALRASGKASLDAFAKRVQQLREINGTDVPWPPNPQFSQAAETQDPVDETPDIQRRDQADTRAAGVAPHIFRFLRIGDGVWTILRAAWLGNDALCDALSCCIPIILPIMRLILAAEILTGTRSTSPRPNGIP